jgi:hypothetical protein
MLFSFPFKGKAGMGMVFASNSANNDSIPTQSAPGRA